MSTASGHPTRLLTWLRHWNRLPHPGKAIGIPTRTTCCWAVSLKQPRAIRWPDELRQRFYEPLGLVATSMAGDEELPPTLANGYVRDDAFLFGADTPKSTTAADYTGLQSVFWAAGGLVSNSSDLVRWARAHYGGTLLDHELYNAHDHPQRLC